MKKIAIAIILFCTLYSAYSLDYRQVIFGNSYKNIIEIDADAFFEQYPAVKEYSAGSESGGTTHARVYEQIIGENTFYRVLLSDEKLTEADFLDWKNLYFDQVVFFKKSNTDLLQVGNINSFKHIDYDDNPVYIGLEIIERNNQVIGIMEYMLSPNSYYKNRAYYYSWQNDDFGDSGNIIIITASNSLVDSKRPFMYTIQNAFDGNPATSYVENTDDDMFYFKIELLGRDYDDYPKCTSYMIINGYASGDYYYQNNQIAKVAVGYDISNGSTSYRLHDSFYLKDTVKPQVMNFEAMKIFPSEVFLRIDVEELTKGTRYNDTAIAEFDIYFEGEGWLFGSSDNDTIDVSPVKVHGYEYNLKDGNAEIVRYTGEGTEVTIPSIIEYENKTYTVTSIGYKAFYDSDLTSITIPDSITSIGKFAFSDCKNLKSITIPDSVTSIGAVAFSGTGLTSITISDSVTSIENGTFSRCENLTSVTIPDSVTSIGSNAFNECSSLKSITIPDSVTSIGSNAFNKCSSLKSMTIPEGVTSIGAYTFYDCENLTSVTIPDSVTSIGDSAFYNCKNLTSVTIPNSVTSIGDSAFSGSGLTSITIPSSVTSIGYYAFSNCENLTSVIIPSSVTSIRGYTFDNCENLTVSVFQGSYALEHAKENDIPYTLIN